MEKAAIDYCTKLKRYYTEDGKLIQYPQKRPMRILALIRIAEQFQAGTQYTEKAVNELIKHSIVFNDVEMIRRELYEYQFLGRQRDGSSYWVEEKWRENYSSYIDV